jgi:hypothetical protein
VIMPSVTTAPDALQPVKLASEREMLGQLVEHFRLAAEDCERLARGERGPIYVQFRARLADAERTCRLVAGVRGDGRWLQIGLRLADVQQRCGQWLREHQPSWRFAGLAEILRRGQASAATLAHKRTERRGPILPVPKPLPEVRQGRPVSMSGLILPRGYAP